MLSIIICSVDKEKIKQVRESISKSTVLENEIIVYNNSENEGLCGVYNQCAEQAKNNVLCFVHDDITFHTHGWDSLIVEYLRDQQIGLVGVMGSRYKSLFGTSWRDGTVCSYRMNIMDGINNGKHLLQNPCNKRYDEVICLDGAFLSCTKEHWQSNSFDENTFKGFHFYDIDISLNMHTAGLRNLVVYDILLEHFSHGKKDKKYFDDFIAFQHKWQNKLPLTLDKEDKKAIKNLEGYSLSETVSEMKSVKYSLRARWIQVRYYYSLHKNWYHFLRSVYFGLLK